MICLIPGIYIGDSYPSDCYQAIRCARAGHRNFAKMMTFHTARIRVENSLKVNHAESFRATLQWRTYKASRVNLLLDYAGTGGTVTTADLLTELRVAVTLTSMRLRELLTTSGAMKSSLTVRPAKIGISFCGTWAKAGLLLSRWTKTPGLEAGPSSTILSLHREWSPE